MFPMSGLANFSTVLKIKIINPMYFNKPFKKNYQGWAELLVKDFVSLRAESDIL